MLLLLLFDHSSIPFPRPDTSTPATRGCVVAQAAVVVTGLGVRIVAHDSVEAQAEMAKKPGDERSGRCKLLFGQRKPSIVWA
jgi:hypothetical protein